MLVPCPSLWFNMGFRKWEVPRGCCHQAGPNPPPAFPQEAPNLPEATGTQVCLNDWGSVRLSDTSTGKGGAVPAFPGLPGQLAHWRGTGSGIKQGETFSWEPLGAPSSVVRVGWQLWGRGSGLCGWVSWDCRVQKGLTEWARYNEREDSMTKSGAH